NNFAMYLTTELAILVIAVGLILYKLLTRNFDYWKKRNVPYVKPIPFFGNFYEIITFRTSIGHFLAKLYNKFESPYFGIFILHKPFLVIKSPEVIKAILVKDFNHFCNRTILSDERCDSLMSKVLFIVDNPEWKIIRSKMTPVFTSGKMKGMVQLINDVSLEMNAYLEKHTSKSFIEAKEVCTKYSTDVIATYAFGIHACSFQNENSEFRAVGRKVLEFEWETALRQIIYFMAPELAKLFRIKFLKPGISEFFRDVFWKTIKLREETNNQRNDLIDILIQMKRQPGNNLDFTGDRVVAQACMFFFAGFETTSATMAFTLYELCLSKEIQNKARLEVKEILAKHGGFTYEALQNMNYLEMIMCETLRKYPVLPFLDRICVKDYKLPNSDLIIEKGTPVYIPMFGIHHDSKIYLEPDKYDPERFSKENRKNLPSFSYIPFGEGPRNCIGERFGVLVGKLGLARILSEYELETSLDTPVPLKFETKTFLLASKVGLPIKFKKIA
ncbi:hypothetical protein ILUMI_12408, partial [Ignelater luminosus]